jgi:hypothetical protein
VDVQLVRRREIRTVVILRRRRGRQEARESEQNQHDQKCDGPDARGWTVAMREGRGDHRAKNIRDLLDPTSHPVLSTLGAWVSSER